MSSLINKFTDKQIKILKNSNYRNSQNYLTTRFPTYMFTGYLGDAIILDKNYTHPPKNIFLRNLEELLIKLLNIIFNKIIDNENMSGNFIFYLEPNKYLVVKKKSLGKIKSQH